jgi:hypothetical protein
MISRFIGGVFAIVAVSAHAEETSIGGLTIHLTAPAGYCVLDKSNADDARLLEGLRATFKLNKLLSVYVACDQLKDFRSGKQASLSEYAQYVTPLNDVDRVVPISANRTVCAELRKKDVQVRLEDMVKDAAPRIREIWNGVKIGESRNLGVLHEDSNACYSAIFQKIRTELGDTKSTVSVSATTVISGKLLTYTIWAPYVDDSSLSNLLMKHQTNVGQLVNANAH